MPRLTEGRFEENFPGSDYSAEEVQFFRAVDRYKRQSGRPHPSLREILRVVKALGYRRPDFPDPPAETA